MRIKYNAPTILTFTLICALVMLLSEALFKGTDTLKSFFMVPGRENFNITNIKHILTLFTHVCGHGGWLHLINNFMIILLIGPMVEENYSSKRILVMIFITAFVTGVLNAIFFSGFLMGASGVAFMLILLSSFTNFSKGEIPVTFILVLILYLGVEILKSVSTEVTNISYYAHIAGGLCGSFFGFLRPQKRRGNT